MKKLLLTLLLLISFATYSQVNFIKKQWPDLLKQAKTENKLIYLDGYTDWCGWCKVLDKEVFTDSAVSLFMNTHFVNTKMEMEKEEWGKKIAMKYGVSGFPTGLVFTSEGKLVYVFKGYSPAPAFLKQLQVVLDPTTQLNLKGYSPGFDVKYPNMYINAMAGNGKRTFPTKKEVNNFLKAQKNPFDEASWSVWKRFKYQLDEPNIEFLFKNIIQFRELYGNEDLDEIVSTRVSTLIDSAAKTNDLKLFKSAIGILEKYHTNHKESKPWFEISYYEKTSNWKEYAQRIDELMAIENGIGENSINEFAWNLYENCNDEDVIRKALTWMKPVIETHQQYDYLDTYASLLYKDKQYELAEKYALQAIEVAKSNNKKYEATEKLLEKIRGKKP